MSQPFRRSHGEGARGGEDQRPELTDLREYMRGDDDINGKRSLDVLRPRARYGVLREAVQTGEVDAMPYA